MFHRIVYPCAIILSTVVATSILAQDDHERTFQSTMQPLLRSYCYECHGNETAEADLNLSAYSSAQQILEGRKVWRKALAKVRRAEMPPKDADAPTDRERQLLADWLDAVINKFDCNLVHNPGRPTLRRLNRTEYRNTIRDLVGVDYEPAKDFPADDVGYGFDNIGDVLSLPPLLMEKYLAAAADISQSAIVDAGEAGALDKTILGVDLEAQSGSATVGQSDRSLFSSGEMSATIEIPLDGKYELQALAYGDQAGPEKVKMSIRLDSKEVKAVVVAAEQSKPATFSASIDVKAGKHKIGLAFLNDYYNPKAPNRADRDRNLIVKHVRITGPADYEPPDLPASHRALVIAKPSAKTPWREAAREVLKRLASRAYRRPATDGELDRLVALTELAEKQGDSYYAGLQLALQAILVSPHFLYKVELPAGEIAKDGTYALDNYQLATSLSYFLWSSMPDDELYGHAWQGTLLQGDNLKRQVGRMLVDPKSRTLITNFAEQWLQLRNLETMRPDPNLFPDYDKKLGDAMRMETLLLFNHILRENRSVLELLTADYTFVDDRLARHYGLQGIIGDKFRQVSLDGTGRGGMLTHASILTITSNPNRTSPVKRGKWILENLLNAPPPPPAPDVMQLEDQQELTGTLRQRMEQHRRDQSCASCHQQMDPLGFALENFDAVGRWRTHDGDGSIDASGELPTGEKFRGAVELQAVLLETKKAEFVRCLTEKLLTYALGRGLEYYDECAVDKIIKAVEQDEYRFASLILEVIKSEPFQKRKSN